MTKTKTVYASQTEWDIGLGGMYFGSPGAVREAQMEALPMVGIMEPIEELEAQNLVGYEKLEVPDDTAGSLGALNYANRVRQAKWPGENSVDTLFRAVEYGGESGEVLDAVKKLVRFKKGIAGNTGQTEEDLITSVMEEMGDALISLDMLATDLGINLVDCVPMKFNKTSRKVGVPVEMDPESWDTVILSDLFSRD